jgi:hypothetical protein
MNEAVGYALLVILGIAIVSSTVIVFNNLQASLASVAVDSEMNRIIEYISDNVLLAYKIVLEGANITLTLELPSSIQGYRYLVEFNTSVDGEKQIVLSIPDKKLSVIKKLCTIDSSITFQGQIDSIDLRRGKTPVITATPGSIVLEVVSGG